MPGTRLHRATTQRGQKKKKKQNKTREGIDGVRKTFFFLRVDGVVLGIPRVSSPCLECISSQPHGLFPSSALSFSCCRGEWPEAITATISIPPPPSSPLHAEIHQGLIFHQQSVKSRQNATQQPLTHPNFSVNYKIKWKLSQSDNQS